MRQVGIYECSAGIASGSRITGVGVVNGVRVKEQDRMNKIYKIGGGNRAGEFIYLTCRVKWI
jgi:hypothetical protein